MRMVMGMSHTTDNVATVHSALIFGLKGAGEFKFLKIIFELEKQTETLL